MFENIFGQANFRYKLLGGFLAMLTLVVVVLMFMRGTLHSINSQVGLLNEKSLPDDMQADEMVINVLTIQNIFTNRSLVGERVDPVELDVVVNNFRRGLEQLRMDQPEQNDFFNRIQDLLEDYLTTGKSMADAYLAGDKAAGNAYMTQFESASSLLQNNMRTLSNKMEADITMSVKDIFTYVSGSVLALPIFFGVSMLVVIGLAHIISKNLMEHLGIDPFYVRGIAKEIAKGDLSREILVGVDQKGSLLAAIAAMQNNLRNMVADVKIGADDITQCSEHLVNATRQMMVSSSHQNRAVNSVSVAVGKMTTSIDQIADNAMQTDSVARKAGEISQQGGKVVEDATAEMHRIAEAVNQSSDIISELGMQSQQISEIVGVIKGIADQTNLLALNAAIEAARAGEYGRGFAVVADEVRHLAERTSQSTQLISSMIEAIQSCAANAVNSMNNGSQRVEEGVEKARCAGFSMIEINRGTEEMVSSVGEISQAIKEQSLSVNQIADKVGVIADMTEKNIESVGDIASAANKLENLAAGLHTSISRFKV